MYNMFMEHNILISLIFFIYGAVAGSFLNVVIGRLPEGEDFVFSRSRCPSCGTALAPADLVPLFSWLFLRGRCRYCGGRIAFRYFLMEALVGLLFVAAYLCSVSVLETVFSIVLVCLMVVVFFIDLNHMIIPDSLSLLTAAAGAAYVFWLHPFPAAEGFLSGFGASCFFLLLYYLSGGGMGGGDIKLVFGLGLWLGWPGIAFAVFLAALAGSIVGVYLMASKKGGMKTEVPFGPFLAATSLTVMFLDESITGIYFNMIF